MVVDFHATWCGPCKMIAPHLEEMDKTMDDVVFLKVDVDECEDIAEEYKVNCAGLCDSMEVLSFISNDIFLFSKKRSTRKTLTPVFSSLLS